MPDERYSHFKDFSQSGVPFPERKKIWLEISDISEDAFDAMMADHSQIKVKVLGNLLKIFTRNLRKANTEIGVLG